MSTVRELLVRLTGDGAQLERELSRAVRNVDAVGRRFERVGKDLTARFTAPILAAGAGIMALTQSAANYADEIDKTAIRTGMARESLQELQFTAGQVGVEFSGIEAALDGFVRRIPQIDRGGTEANRAMQRLGVSVRDADGNLRSMQDIFPELVDGLAQIENHTDRSSVALQLFGRQGRAMLPMLDLGADGLLEMGQRARDLGLVMSDEAIRDLVAYKDAWAEVTAQLGAAGREVAVGFLPILREQLVPFIQRGVVPRVREWTFVLRELDGEQVRTIATTAGVVAAIGPAVFAFGSLIRTGASLLRVLQMMVGAKAALGSLLLPGGIVIAGLSLLAIWFARNQLEATRAAIATAGLRAEIAGLSAEERTLRTDRLQAELADAVTELNRASGALAELRSQASQGTATGALGLGLDSTMPIVEAAQAFEAAKDRVRELSQELGMLGDAERRSAEMAEELRRAQERAALTAEELVSELAGLGGGLADLETPARSAADVIDDLAQRMRSAEILSGLSDVWDRDAMAVAAYRSALQELVELGLDPTDERVREITGNLEELRGRMSESEAAAREQAEAMAIVNQLLDSTRTATETYQMQVSALTMLLDAGAISHEAFARAMAAAEDQLERSTQVAEIAARTWRDDWANGVVNAAIRVDRGFSEMSRNILRQIATVTTRLLVMRGLMQMLMPFAGGSGLGGALFNAVSAPFGGARAMGGPVHAGRAYLVGERGPELIVPRSAGNVVPNSALGGGASAGAVADAVLARVGSPPAHASPEVVATTDYYRRLISAIAQDAAERGVRFPT